MKWAVMLVLAAVLFGVLVPQSAEMVSIRNGHLMIGSLDVCHSSAPALSTNGDMPYLNAAPPAQAPASLIAHTNIADPVFPQFLFPQQNDRPPKA